MKGCKREFLFGSLRTAGEQDHIVRINAGECCEFLGAWILAIGFSAVEFEVASDMHVGGAEGSKTLGIRFVLRCDQIDVRQHAFDERPQPTLAAKAPFTQTPVEDSHRYTFAMRGMQQIRPQFQFGQNEHIGPHAR